MALPPKDVRNDPQYGGGNEQQRRQTIRRLAEAIRRIEQPVRRWARRRISSGIPALDAVLPGGGFVAGHCIEWIRHGPGCGAWSLALQVSRSIAQGPLVIVDPASHVFPPALWAMGLASERVWFVRPTGAADTSWAVERALRCSAAGAVFAELPAVPLKTMRRLQLAAEEGGTLAVLVRPWSARRSQGFSHTRILVKPLPGGREPPPATQDFVWQAFRRVSLQVVRAANRSFQAKLILELAYAADRLHISPELADPTVAASAP